MNHLYLAARRPTRYRGAIRCSIYGGKRCLSGARILLSGHSRWSTIKHDKAIVDQRRGKERNRMAQEIQTAVKLGGPDLMLNTRLVAAINQAKKAGVPKANIESSLKRGQGLSSTGKPLERLTIEFLLPPNIAGIVECETEGKLRLLSNLRLVLDDFGASITPTAYMFDRRGSIELEAAPDCTIDEAELLEAALAAGALDMEENPEKNGYRLLTDSSEVAAVAAEISKLPFVAITNHQLVWTPKADLKGNVDSEELATKIHDMMAKLEEHPDVQHIFLND